MSVENVVVVVEFLFFVCLAFESDSLTFYRTETNMRISRPHSSGFELCCKNYECKLYATYSYSTYSLNICIVRNTASVPEKSIHFREN